MLYRMTEWQSDTGKWHCGCVDDLAKSGNHWTLPARILKMPLVDYIQWVIDNFNPTVWHSEDCSLVFFSWDNQADERRFKNTINKAARDCNFQI